jgi:hypothetical protein
MIDLHVDYALMGMEYITATCNYMFLLIQLVVMIRDKVIIKMVVVMMMMEEEIIFVVSVAKFIILKNHQRNSETMDFAYSAIDIE